MQLPMNVTNVVPFSTLFEGNTTAAYAVKYSAQNVVAITFLEKFSRFRDRKEFATNAMGLSMKICSLTVDFLVRTTPLDCDLTESRNY